MKMNWIGTGILSAAAMLGLATAQPAKAESHFSFGVTVGPSYGYYAPVPVYRPPYPGPGYYWTDGYYDPYGVWINGFWARPGYVRPYRYVAPRYYNRDYRRGYDRDDFRGRGRDRGRRR